MFPIQRSCLRAASVLTLCFCAAGCYGPSTGGDPQVAITRLIDLLSDPNPEIRRTAVMGLGKIGVPSAGPSLLPLLRDEDPRVRQWAAWALGQLGERAPSSAAQQLVTLLADSSSETRSRAAMALGEVPSYTDMTHDLMLLLQSEREDVRRAAAYAWLNVADRGRLEITSIGRGEPSSSVRQALAAVSGESGASQAVTDLVARLEGETSAAVRAEIVYRLGLLGGEDASAVARRLANSDPSETVRRWAMPSAAVAAASVRSEGK